MWKNYLKIAIRNLWRQRSFSLINILGLAIGMACCFLIIQYVWHESNYDRFHPKLDRLYRISYHANFSQESTLARTPPAFTSRMLDYFPEMEQVARMYPRDVSVSVGPNQDQYEIEQVYFADTNLLDLFHFDFRYGQATNALKRPFSVIITEELAQRFYGRSDVLGEAITLSGNKNFHITGVIEKWPDQAHMEIDMLIPYDNMIDLEPEHARETMERVLTRNWTASHSYAYVLLEEGQDKAAVDAKFAAYIQEFGTENVKEKQAFSLFPVKDIHLRSTASLEQKVPANTNMLLIFMGIGLITLLIACINFINLTTASSLNRAKEVGVRKTLGASRSLLIGQFLGESFLLSFIAFALSLLITYLALPYLNLLTGVNISQAPWENAYLFLFFLGIFGLAGLLAGSYPAFFVSRFQAIHSLKGKGSPGQKTGGQNLRKALITLQFLATIVFISGAFIMYLQLQYV
ncbi:MAG: ABC transporter permease, partial [Bacteroidota bacterium]